MLCSRAFWSWLRATRRQQWGEVSPLHHCCRCPPLPPTCLASLVPPHPAPRPTLCLTCKCWRDLFYSSPALWRAFTLAPHPDRYSFTPGRLAAQLGLLARVAPVVESFQCNHCAAIDVARSSSGGGCSLLHFLRLLQPGVTTAVGLAGLPCDAAAAATGSALVRELLRLPHLTRLELSQAGTADQGEAGLPAGTPALLLCLPALQSLALETELPLPAGTLEAIKQLGQLTALRLQARPLPDLAPLTSLQRLRRLALADRCSWLQPSDEEQGMPPVAPPPPAAFRSGLQELTCSTISRGLEVCTGLEHLVWCLALHESCAPPEKELSSCGMPVVAA